MSSQPSRTITSLRPAALLVADKPHGMRLRYMAGCRCDACRKANSSYENERQKARKAGDWNGIVPANRARAHLQALSRHGVGRRTVQACTDIADTILSDIRTGRKTRIRARTERLILGVTKAQAADHALISARKSMRLLDALLQRDYTKTFIATRLGYKSRALQFNADTITVRNADRIERLHRELLAVGVPVRTTKAKPKPQRIAAPGPIHYAIPPSAPRAAL